MSLIQPSLKDLLGKRGECLFGVMISRWHSNNRPIFDAVFLGDKQPCVDFIVQLLDAPIIAHFYVQVKTTRQGYTKKDNRLKVKAKKQAVCTLADYPAPTYIIGIDDNNNDEKGYIVSANGEYRAAMSSLSTQFPIDEPNRIKLWNEVKDFWIAKPSKPFPSVFKDTDWR